MAKRSSGVGRQAYAGNFCLEAVPSFIFFAWVDGICLVYSTEIRFALRKMGDVVVQCLLVECLVCVILSN